MSVLQDSVIIESGVQLANFTKLRNRVVRGRSNKVENQTNLVNDPVAGGDVSDVCRLLELHLVLERREPYRLVGLGLGHDDDAAVPMEDAKRLFVGHPRSDLLGQQSLVPRIHGKARLFPAAADAAAFGKAVWVRSGRVEVSITVKQALSSSRGAVATTNGHGNALGFKPKKEYSIVTGEISPNLECYRTWCTHINSGDNHRFFVLKFAPPKGLPSHHLRKMKKQLGISREHELEYQAHYTG